ncbi:MAG: HEPN domain-containing protein [Verrucomicrobiota bacterium]
MIELEHARQLLTMAGKDLAALKAMTDRDSFAEEIFGFHAQQAIEKCLKAWLSALSVQYPLRHDLAELLGLLNKQGRDTSAFKHLISYTDYAVAFRYEQAEDVAPQLDRPAVCAEVQQLYDHVQKVIEQ